jgi:SynChlorMet cassette protein ScmC
MKDHSKQIWPSSCTSPPFLLSLASGARLALDAGDEAACKVLNFLGRAARMSTAPSPLPDGVRRLLVVTDTGQDRVSPCPNDAPSVCALAHPGTPLSRRRTDLAHISPKHRLAARLRDPEPLPEDQWFWQQLSRLSAAIARETQSLGGVLLHSGLAFLPSPQGGEGQDEGGVLLAGRSGVGKSTASRRLPPPWRALADDVTLVLRCPAGTYSAHPWPTWSRFFGDKAGDGSDTWDVQQAVPLRAIIVLEQGAVDSIEPLGPGHTLALLSELAQQTSTYLLPGMSHAELSAFHLQRFDNLCALVRTVPGYLLHMSQDGSFWTEIERVLW